MISSLVDMFWFYYKVGEVYAVVVAAQVVEKGVVMRKVLPMTLHFVV